MKPTIRLARPTFDPEEIEAVTAVLSSGNLVQGARVAAFEEAVCAYLGVKHAVACSSGTAALHLCALALGLSAGDEVIVPSYTFPATANMVEIVGARAVIVDVDPRTFNIDPDGVRAAITDRTRAIIAVDLFGLCANLPALAEIAQENELVLVEDAACALGGKYRDAQGQSRHAGAEAALACWSFHPRKVITTCEGGMVTTDDAQLAAELRSLRNHGATLGDEGWEYHRVGPNYRMTDLQGALGVTQMARLEGFIEARQALASAYDQGLKGLEGLTRPLVPEGYRHTYQAYVCLVEPGLDRAALIQGLREQGVEATIGTYAVHQQPYYRARYGLQGARFPGTESASARALALPLHPGMGLGDVERVVSTLRELLR